jgi:hypothetical protein
VHHFHAPIADKLILSVNSFMLPNYQKFMSPRSLSVIQFCLIELHKKYIKAMKMFEIIEIL